MARPVRDDHRAPSECSTGIFIVVFSRDSSGTSGILLSGIGVSRHRAAADLTLSLSRVQSAVGVADRQILFSDFEDLST